MATSLSTEFDWVALAREAAKSGHALLGPSTLPRLFRCSGSLQLALRRKKSNDEKEWTIEGSQAHYLAEKVFASGDYNVSRFKGVKLSPVITGKVRPFKPDTEMCDAVQEYIDWCVSLPGTHFFETRVSLDRWMPLPFQFGRTDHAAIHADTLTTTDFKYGLGVQIYAKENEQAMAYALGTWAEWEWAYAIKRVVIRICQPRLDHFDEWECSIEQLLEFGERLRAQMQLVLSDRAYCVAGKEQCQFCPVSGACETQAKTVEAVTHGDFEDFDSDDPSEFSKPELMSYESLSKALRYRELIKIWLRKIEERATRIALRDSSALPEWKVVEGKSNRQYIDPDEAEIFLRRECKLPEEAIIEKKLISPAQAEKKIPKNKRKEFAAFWNKPKGRPTLVPADAKGNPYKVADAFAEDLELLNVDDDDDL